MTAKKGEDKSDSDEAAGMAQINVTTCTQFPRQVNKQQVRHRASVACASCRDRRIRCVVPKGESECVQCKKAGSECIIKNDDERRRPISKAYMCSLSSRIAMLEGMLLEKGIQPPPAAHPPRTRHEAPTLSEGPQDQREIPVKRPIVPEVPSPPDSGTEDFKVQDGDCVDAAAATSPGFRPVLEEQYPFRRSDSGQEGATRRLLSTRGDLSFDQLSGRLRYFGSTANSHVCDTELTDEIRPCKMSERVRRAERIIQTLTNATHDYLMNSFWTHYNSVLKIVHRESLESDRESQDPKFYSPFLHIAILAMGFRFADPAREDIKRVALGKRESILHREVKLMLDIELERPGGIPSVQALLLLGDLECGVGRDNTGWMYAGMANRLAFDVGLHLDCRGNGISEQEADIRHMVMRACVVYDKYWALFLGRPTSIKNQDIEMDLFSRRSSQLTSLMGRRGPADKEDITVDIYDHLVELMDLAGRIVENRDKIHTRDSINVGDEVKNDRNSKIEEVAYLHVIGLNRQLQNWYKRLPEHLQWKPVNIKHAPFSYYLLHQQYHVSMVLLHRPWAKYGEIAGDNTSPTSYSASGSKSDATESSNQQKISDLDQYLELNSSRLSLESSRTASSRRICSFHAIRVARIFWQHRQLFDGAKIFVTGIQHAGTAATALAAALSCHRSESDRRTYLGYLEILASAIGGMSQTYEPAARMNNLLKTVLVQLRTDISDTGRLNWPPVALKSSERSLLSSSDRRWSVDSMHSVLPSRQEADTEEDGEPRKRRRLSTTGLREPGFARPSLPFFTTQTQGLPCRSSQGHSSVDDHSPFDSTMFTMNESNVQHFNLDFHGGSAIALEQDKASDYKTGPTEDSIFVTPPFRNWSLGTLAESATSTSISKMANFGYDGLMSEWASGSPVTNLDSPPVTQVGRGGNERTCSMNRAGPWRALSDKMRQSETNDYAKKPSKSPEVEPFRHGGMGLMDSEVRLNTLGSVSLGELVQSSIADKMFKDRTHETPRNHELDFLSL